ncbi:hypothetical protein ABGB18_21490 [Nonomuraea sp. B12E4]|uniref:hypothetical protein n=1 Tax=Nonomuraea sp. B12E4 TaxID=3153564 RepID=UPI00325EC1D2
MPGLDSLGNADNFDSFIRLKPNGDGRHQPSQEDQQAKGDEMEPALPERRLYQVVYGIGVPLYGHDIRGGLLMTPHGSKQCRKRSTNV